MNECANKKILAHTHARHQETIREARTERKRETTQLLDSLTGQAGLVDSLERLGVDSAQTVSSLTQLVGEKDRVRSSFIVSRKFCTTTILAVMPRAPD